MGVLSTLLLVAFISKAAASHADSDEMTPSGFSSLVLFETTTNLIGSTKDQELFVQIFTDTYNEENTCGSKVCDPQNRTLTNGTVLLAFEPPTARRRNLQSFLDGVATFVINVTGQCSDCEQDAPLFRNDVSGRRRRQLSHLRHLTKYGYKPPPPKVQELPSAGEVLVSFQRNLAVALPKVLVFDLGQVDCVTNSDCDEPDEQCIDNLCVAVNVPKDCIVGDPCPFGSFCSDNPSCGYGRCMPECDSNRHCGHCFACNCWSGRCEYAC